MSTIFSIPESFLGTILLITFIFHLSGEAARGRKIVGTIGRSSFPAGPALDYKRFTNAARGSAKEVSGIAELHEAAWYFLSTSAWSMDQWIVE